MNLFPEFSDLSVYNAEKARGLVHSPKWVAKMVTRQAEFSAKYAEQIAAEGWVEVGDGIWAKNKATPTPVIPTLVIPVVVPPVDPRPVDPVVPVDPKKGQK